jgi:hypothetical protein
MGLPELRTVPGGEGPSVRVFAGSFSSRDTLAFFHSKFAMVQVTRRGFGDDETVK